MTAVKRPAAEEAALQVWGPLFMRDRTASPKLDALLRGIARCISEHYGTNRYGDLRPTALASFYRSVGGDYDQLFKETPSQSLAFIYKNLRCPYSLQPASPINYEDPTIPALKPRGFVIWQTIQLMLGPEEHVPFIQNALQVYDVRDPDTGIAFPKSIPQAAFPPAPDPVMVKWHEDIGERLHVEAQQVITDEGRPLSRESTEGSLVLADERKHAAGHFANPMYKNREGRPTIVKQLTKAPGQVLQGGKSMALSMYQGGKLVLSPNLFGSSRKKSHSRSPSRDRDDIHRHGHSGRHMSVAESRRPASPHRTSSHDKPRRGSRHVTPSPTTSEEEADLERERRRRLRRYKSHDGTSPNHSRDSSRRRRHHSADSKQKERTEERAQTVRPSYEPPLAVRIAQQQAQINAQNRGETNSSARRSSQQVPATSHPKPIPLRPPPHRTSSEHGSASERDRVRRSQSHDYTDGDTTTSRSTRPRGTTLNQTTVGDTPTIYEGQLSPGAQEEWTALKQNISGQNSSPGAESGESGASQGRRESVAVGVGTAAPGVVQGAKGRRFVNEAPWAVG